MYKVYRDPEGKKFLQRSSTIQITNKSITSENEETYKKRIESLNAEIKVLKNELEMVNAVSCQCAALTFLLQFKSGQADSEEPKDLPLDVAS